MKQLVQHSAAEDIQVKGVPAQTILPISSTLHLDGDLSIIGPAQMLAPADAPAGKNVIMLSIDDLNAFVLMKDLYGSILQTPNLDHLMAMGTTFTNAFAQTALCNPSRTSILSGQFPTTTGVFDNEQNWSDTVSPASTLFAQFLNAGYDVQGGGKLFHNANLNPADQAQMFTGYFNATGAPPDPGASATPYTGDPALLTDSQTATWAVNYLSTHTGSTPFMLNVGLEATHVPWFVPQSYYDMYNPSSLPLPPHQVGDLSDIPQFIIDRMGGFTVSTAHWQHLLQGLFASISYVDAQIGNVLTALHNSGQEANTAIVLWSDHGYQAGDKDNWGKFTLWDTAAKAPLIIVDPGVTAPGTTVDHTVSLLDIYPTITDIAGLTHPSGVEGTSLMPLLQDPTSDWNESAFTFMYGSWSVRTDDYRYIHYEDGSQELYNETTDPNEFTNLVNDSSYATVLATMKANGIAALACHGFLQDDSATSTRTIGTAGNDIMTSPSPTVVMHGEAGDDTYFVWTPTQQVHELANNGTDTIFVDGSYTMPANVEVLREEFFDSNSPAGTLIGNNTDNSIYGGTGGDTLQGNGGNDFLEGFWGNDILNGGDGDDNIDGGKGDDSIVGGAGNDTINGSQGNDTVTYASSTSAVVANLSTKIVTDGLGGTDTLTSVENITGSNYNDTITGTNGDNNLAGLSGDDTLNGKDGNDRLSGSDGNDILWGGNGQDKIITGAGADTVRYLAAAESTGATFDILTDFDAVNDHFKMASALAVTGLDAAVTTGVLNLGSFDTQLAAAVGAGQLASHHAALFTPDSGNEAGHTFLVIDANGVAGYQAGADLVILVDGMTGTLSAANFTT